MENSSSSGFGRFFRGFGSGIFSGGLMMGICYLLGAVSILPALPLMTMVGTICATGLFSGTMATIRGKSHTPQAVPVMVNGVPGRGLAPEQSVVMTPSMDAPEQASQKWADRVNRRSPDGQSYTDALQAKRAQSNANGMSV